MLPRNFLFAAIILGALNVSAQKNLYLKPSVGIGFSNVKAKTNNPLINTDENKSIFTYNATAGIGYKVKKWRIESGIAYARTGTQIKDLLFVNSSNMGIDTGRVIQSSNHIIVPFRIAYQIELNKRLSLNPTIGAAVSFNYSGETRISLNKAEVKDYTSEVSSNAFWNTHRPVTVFGEAQLNTTYKINKTIDVFGGPALQYMLNSSMKKPEVGVYHYNQYPYTLMLNAGINWHFIQEKAADTPAPGN